jgi:hypothetical protein
MFGFDFEERHVTISDPMRLHSTYLPVDVKRLESLVENRLGHYEAFYWGLS